MSVTGSPNPRYGNVDKNLVRIKFLFGVDFKLENAVRRYKSDVGGPRRRRHAIFCPELRKDVPDFEFDGT